jgi:drug/metabolite transporter (DMT)-like permease
LIQGLVFGIISTTCFGISNVYWKKAVLNDDFSRIVFFRGLLTVMMLGLLWLFLFKQSTTQTLLVQQTTIRLADLLLMIALCLVSSLGLVFYLLSLQYAPVSISVPLSSINVFNILTAVFVLGEVFKPVYYFSFSLAGAGVWLINRKVNQDATGWNRGAAYAILASVFWGITYALFKFPATRIGAIPLAFTLESCVMITALIWNRVAAPPVYSVFSGVCRQQSKHYFILALLLLGGTVFYNLAVQLKDVLVLTLVGNLSLVISVILGIVWQKENITTMQVAGLILILCSLFAVQLS